MDFAGFASFFFIIGFLMITAISIYVSPLFCGSPNEKKMIRTPQEVDLYQSETASAPPVANAV